MGKVALCVGRNRCHPITAAEEQEGGGCGAMEPVSCRGLGQLEMA